MRHIELFESKNFKDWKKYNDYLSKMFSDDDDPIFPNVNSVSICSEKYGTQVVISMSIKYDYNVSNIALVKLFKYFSNLEFKIFPSKGAVIVEVYKIPIEFFNKIDIEMNAHKYNI